MNRLLIVAFCNLLILSSCHYFRGEHMRGTGNVITQTRDVSHFTGVDVSSAIDLYLKQDSAFAAKVVTDDNLQQYIQIREENGILYIQQRDNTSLDPSGKIKVYISAPLFTSMRASGACNITSENRLSSNENISIDLSGASDARLDIKALKISAGLSGACTLALKGEAKELSVDGSGSSNIKCFDLMTEQTKIDISGACDAEVFASVKLDIEASGSSDVKYRGNAAVSQNISGAGSVKRVDTPTP
ncbi:MAG: head GIN domain-containing protein [Bacteroidota bacterium]|nr:head GIN domain-containing protein [Bacteroidota bacterium]